MKRTSTLLIAIGLVTLNLFVLAQAPAKFNYQAVARNASGALLTNQNVAVRFTIRDLTPSGASLYQETHNVTTNGYGLFTAVIGGGTAVSGNLSGISWISGNKFLQVEIDPTGGTNYTDMGTTQLISVPYAVQAKEAESITLYPSGTSNPDKIILAHSPLYSNYGIVYKDTTDILRFHGDGVPLLDLWLNDNLTEIKSDLKISSGTPGTGKVLTSDANGNASWKSVGPTLSKGGLNIGSVTVTSTGTALNIGTVTYNKLQANTELVVELNSRISSGTFAGGATNIVFEIQVDGVSATDRNVYPIFSSNTTEFVNLKSVFKNLSPGNHTITVVGKTNAGTSTGVLVDSGGYQGRIFAKETW